MNTTLCISSHYKNYEIHFVKNEIELMRQFGMLQDIVFVIDNNIAKLYPELTNRISKLGAIYKIDALEQNKTLAGAEDILAFFQSVNVSRTTTIIAIGGGILQDVTSFAGHIFNRGLKVILVPTTLLAMCDSCIGGKCGVNFNGYKNQLGAFHPPEKVLIWPQFLSSLPEEDVRSGYGEILKYALLNNKEQYVALKQVLSTDNWVTDGLVSYIYEGLATKKKLVEQDEFDTGVRRLLNVGHTFGHAIERATDHVIPHGIAVTKGIDIENYIALRLGFLSQDIFMDVHAMIKKHFGCELNPIISAEMLVENIQKDKKIQYGKLHLVLMEDYGHFRIEPVMLDDKFIKIVNDYLIFLAGTPT